MEPFEYVVVLTSLILGLGLSQILIGISNVISNYRNVKLSLPHSLLVVIIFMTHIQEWWINYQYSKTIHVWTLPMVLSLLIYPTLLFLYARILFPPLLKEEKKIDLNKYYFEHWKLFFGGGLLAVMISMWQNVIISNISLDQQLPQWGYGLSYLVFLVFRIEKRIIHTIYFSLQIVSWIFYIVTDSTTL